MLREAIKNGDADFDHMQEDADLDPIRDLPAFGEIMKAGHPDRRYAAVWSSDRAVRAGRDPRPRSRRPTSGTAGN